MKEGSKEKKIAEFFKNFIVPFGFVYIIVVMGLTDTTGLLVFSVVFWIVFPVNILFGSVMWEKVPALLAAYHAGDWMIKLILFAIIFGLLH